MRVHYTLTLEDFREARQAMGHSTRWLFNGVIAFGGFFVLMLGIMGRVWPHDQSPSTTADGLAPLAWLILLSPLYVGLILIRVFSRRQRRLCRDISTKTIWVLRAIGAVTGLAALWLGLTRPDMDQEKIGGAIVYFAAGLIGVVVLAFKSSRGLDATLWKPQIDQQRPKEMELRVGGLVISDGVSRYECQWIAFLRGVETPNLFVLSPNSLSMLMIPKRAFASDADRAAFAKAMTEGIHPPTHAFPMASTPPPLPPQFDDLPEAQLCSPQQRQL